MNYKYSQVIDDYLLEKFNKDEEFEDLYRYKLESDMVDKIVRGFLEDNKQAIKKSNGDYGEINSLELYIFTPETLREFLDDLKINWTEMYLR